MMTQNKEQQTVAPLSDECDDCYHTAPEEYLLNLGNNAEYQGYWAIYILLLEEQNWYVGMSRYLHNRIRCHFLGMGSHWTRKYKPVAVSRIIRIPGKYSREQVELIEDQYTFMMMKRKGISHVRGGQHCKRWPFNRDEKQELLNKIRKL